MSGGIAILLMPRRKEVVLARARLKSLKILSNEETDESLHLKY